MSTEVGSIYLSLNLKDNVQAQIGHLASKADRQAASSFKRVGDTAGKAISRAMANIKLPTQPLNRSVESAKAKIEQLRVAMGALDEKMDAISKRIRRIIQFLQRCERFRPSGGKSDVGR